MEKVRKARKSKSKAKAETVERAWALVNSKSKEKAEIARVNAEAVEIDKLEA